MLLSFANPWFLLGAVSIGIPIYLHLYYRKTPLLKDFPSLRLIRASIEAVIRRMKLKNYLLLALRIFVIMMLVGALAKPYIGRGTAIGSGVPSAFAVVLDNSLSMGTTVQGVSFFNSAKARAIEIIENMGPDDKAVTVLLNDPGSMLFSQLTWDKTELKESIRNATLSMSGTNLHSSLTPPLKLLSQVQSFKRAVYVITDMTKASWQSFLATYDLDRIDPGIDLILVPIGDKSPDNLAITQMTMESPIVMSGKSAATAITVSNFSERKRSTRLSLFIDGEKKHEVPIEIEGRVKKKVIVECVFPREGIAHVRASLPTDTLPYDDDRHLAVRVSAPMKMLLVKPDPNRQGKESGEDVFLRFALNPMNRTKSAVFPVESRTSREAEILEFAQYSVIFLANPGHLSDEFIVKLSDYLLKGGNVAVFLGNRADPEWLNKSLADNPGGRYILPARIFRRVGNAVSRSIAYQLTDIDYGHPTFSIFRSESNGDPSRARIFEFYQVRPNPLALVLARMSHGLPAIVEEQRGQGKVVLVTFPADTSWSDWPLKPTFLPFIHQMIVGMMSSHGLETQSVKPGTPVSMLASEEGLQKVVLTDPTGGESELSIRKEGEGLIHFSTIATNKLGFHHLKLLGKDGTKVTAFTVNTDPDESDLERIDVKSIPRFILLDHKVGSKTSLSEKVIIAKEGREVGLHLLWLLLLIALIESIIANVPSDTSTRIGL